MKQEILTKCGYRCDLCLAFKPNVEAKDRRKELSDGWYAIYGFRIQPDEIVCDGCVSCENPSLIDKGCPVRSCVLEKGLNNCAYCDDYPCEDLQQIIVNRSAIEEKLERVLTDYEYQKFVIPYESKQRLDALRNTRR